MRTVHRVLSSGQLFLRTVLCAGALLAFVSRATPASGQAMDVPVVLQVQLVLKALTFDQRAAPSTGVSIVAIAYQGGHRASVRARDEVVAALRTVDLRGVPEYVTDGLAVGLVLRAERPKFIANLQASRLEGGDFSSEFLKLVELVR